MAIMPISGIRTQTNYNSSTVNFEGKKDCKASSSVTTGPLKAVPVALLIALSPINAPANGSVSQISTTNTTAIQPQTKSPEPVYTEKFFVNSQMANRVNFYSSTGSKKAIDKVEFQYLTGNPHRVLELNNIKMTLVGDDGVPNEVIAHKQIVMRDDKYSLSVTTGDSHPKRVEFFEKFINGQNPNVKNAGAIKTRNINSTLRLGKDGVLQNGEPDTGWYEFARKNPESFGERFWIKNLNTIYGDYILRFYENDGDDNNFEVVTINKKANPKTGEPEGPELKVNMLKLEKIKLADAGGTVFEDCIGIIEVAKRNKTGSAQILNNQLFNFLVDLWDDPGYNKCYELKDLSGLEMEAFKGKVYPKD